MSAKTYTRSFSGGELDPEFFGAIGDAKHAAGLARCRNFLIQPHGPISSRPGFQRVADAAPPGQPADARVRLIPFIFSDEQSLALEVGPGYLRFHTLGATVESSPGIPLAVATRYLSSQLFGLRYEQSNDVMSLVHTAHAPAELKRLSPTSWSLEFISFAAMLAPPSGLRGAATAGQTPGTPTSHVYAVTATDRATESSISTSIEVQNNLLDNGAKNTVSWDPVPGADGYKVYKRVNGLFGYIGRSADGSFIDDNIAPDLGTTPPIHQGEIFSASTATRCPGAVTYFEQRRWFAGSIDTPITFYATRSGTESDMSYSLPSKDTDALQFKAAAREASRIKHLVPLGTLMALTGSAEWIVTSVNADAITPSSFRVKPQSYVGASDVRPLIVNSNIVYAAARGSHLHEIGYSQEGGGFVTGDLMHRCSHLLDGASVVDLAYSKTPTPIVWAVLSDGRMLAMTYVPGQGIGGFSWIDTDGAVESVCVVPEGQEDAVYIVARRQLRGQQTRTIERMHSRAFRSLADAFFVDCGATYRGEPTKTVTGLTWLDGRTVSILADGAVVKPQKVVSGAISLPAAASVVHVGLPYACEAQGLPVYHERVPGMGQGVPKALNKAWLRVHKSSGIWFGPRFDRLVEFKQRTTEPLGSPPSLYTGSIEITALSGGWDAEGQWCVRQSDPLPLTITSITLDVAFGG